MRRRYRAALVLTALVAALLVSPRLSAASSSPSLPSHAPALLRITLGQAAFPLNGPWKFSVGDSPLDPSNGEPLWAEPGFDDSSWETVDLTPAAGSYEPIQGVPSWVPGWTSKGHPGYWGYAWYRIRVEVDPQNPAEQGDRNLKLALERIASEKLTPEAQEMVDFIRASKRGVAFGPREGRVEDSEE